MSCSSASTLCGSELVGGTLDLNEFLSFIRMKISDRKKERIVAAMNR